MLEDFDELHRRWADLKAAVWAERWSLIRFVVAVELLIITAWLVTKL